MYTYIYIKPSKWFTGSSAEYSIGRMFHNNGRSKKQLKDLIHAFTIIRHALSFSTFQRLVLLTIIAWCWTKITSSLLKPQNFERTKLYQAWIYIYIFLSLDRLFGRNNVTSDKANVKPDIRQDFSKKILTSRVCVSHKTIWSYFTLINIKLR